MISLNDDLNSEENDFKLNSWNPAIVLKNSMFSKNQVHNLNENKDPKVTQVDLENN